MRVRDGGPGLATPGLLDRASQIARTPPFSEGAASAKSYQACGVAPSREPLALAPALALVLPARLSASESLAEAKASPEIDCMACDTHAALRG